MEHWVYIIHSNKLDKFYIGETTDLKKRLTWHKSGYFKGSFTKASDDWEIFIKIKCHNRTNARKIEGHIKRMKSKSYIRNLKKYPEIIDRLLKKYA